MTISLDVLPAPAVVLDRDGVIVAANDRAADVLGVECGPLVGLSLEHMLSGHEIRSNDSDEQAEWDISGRRFRTIEDAGASKADERVILLADVSDLTGDRDQAMELARARSGFLGKLSHEIRSAVASMIGFAEMLESEVPSADRELARVITMSGRHLIDTLNAVMDLARVEFGEKEVELTEVDVISRMRERVMILRPDAVRKGLELTFSHAEHVLPARLNPIFLDRILHNLIDNAIKYTEEGHVEIEAKRRDGRIWIYVADTGRGMDAAFIPRLFAPFERERGDDDEGTGLGLAVTRYLVELMDGEIFASSKEGEGSTFTVSFPEPPAA